ncbi:MAG TPA: homoserine kinase [Spirochaetes bacterium]|nr:homoserine kinase [Spirochaetota bacterium]
MVKVQVPASTANIGPGFDILGLALTLYNTVEVELLSEPTLDIEYAGEGKEYIPTDSSNMIYKSIQRVFSSLNKPLNGLRIKIDNEIPLMGGLGSSSSAIVSGIVAANALLDNPLTKRDMLKLAVEEDGHPDNVTPALLGGFTLSYRDEEENPSIIPLIFPSGLDIVTVSPDFHVSTQSAREVMPENYPLKVVTKNATRLIRLIRSLEKGQWDELQSLLEDELHQPYRFPLVPGLKKACEKAYQSGAVGAFISGSGPTLAIFCHENREKVGQSVVEVFEQEKLEAKVRYLKVDFEGARIID